MTDKEVELEIREYYPDEVLWKVDKVLERNIHSNTFTLKNGTNIRLRFCSPNSFGDKPKIMWNYINEKT